MNNEQTATKIINALLDTGQVKAFENTLTRAYEVVEHELMAAQSLKGEGEKEIRICPNCEEKHNEDDLNGFCSASCLQGLE